MTVHSDSASLINIASKSRAASSRKRTVLVNNYVTNARIGVYSHEKERRQQIRLSLRVEIDDNDVGHRDQFEDVMCYKSLIDQIEGILAVGHINLVETLAERILDMLAADSRSNHAWIRVEKLEAIPAAESVGVELERRWTA